MKFSKIVFGLLAAATIAAPVLSSAQVPEQVSLTDAIATMQTEFVGHDSESGNWVAVLSPLKSEYFYEDFLVFVGKKGRMKSYATGQASRTRGKREPVAPPSAGRGTRIPLMNGGEVYVPDGFGIQDGKVPYVNLIDTEVNNNIRLETKDPAELGMAPVGQSFATPEEQPRKGMSLEEQLEQRERAGTRGGREENVRGKSKPRGRVEIK